MNDAQDQINPTRIRIGLVIIAVIFVASVVLVIVVNEALAQAIFFAVAVVCIVRIVLLVRWLRRQRSAAPPS